LSVSTHYLLNVDDYVELAARQRSGGTLSASFVEFGMVKLP
jgi:hypothetical protein